ncbi:MAG: hypothetical protein NTV97_08950 [Alphaproteobacteria bacterium]|nr:hypothetical protein [Alphaproteobacteria bacterium]
MATAPMSYTSQAAESASTHLPQHDSEQRERPVMGLDGELADLYSAVLVVVPLAFLLRWLWP